MSESDQRLRDVYGAKDTGELAAANLSLRSLLLAIALLLYSKFLLHLPAGLLLRLSPR